MGQQLGRIRLGHTVFDVAFEKADRSVDDVIDAANRAKYRQSPYLAPMLAPDARAATVRISPHTPDRITPAHSAGTNGLSTARLSHTDPWLAPVGSEAGHHR
jgi:hypothetical protein